MTKQEMAVRLIEIWAAFQTPGDPPTPPPNAKELCVEVCELAGQAEKNGWTENRVFACFIRNKYCDETYGFCEHCELAS